MNTCSINDRLGKLITAQTSGFIRLCSSSNLFLKTNAFSFPLSKELETCKHDAYIQY